MKVQLLISAVKKDPKELVRKMNVETDAILINQCDTHDYEKFLIQDINGTDREVKAYSFCERGVGLSRNNALLRADKEISLFSDDDIIYEKGYEDKIIRKESGGTQGFGCRRRPAWLYSQADSPVAVCQEGAFYRGYDKPVKGRKGKAV